MDKPTFDKSELPNDAELDTTEEPVRASENWVRELVAMTRPGCEIQFPVRQIGDRDIPFVYDDFS